MPTLHLICGLPCAGKTTFARRLERQTRALRLTPDEWITRLFPPDIDEPSLDALRDPIEAALWDLAAHFLRLNVDVILDFGFWSRAERDDFKNRAAQLGAGTQLHYLELSEPELLARLATRNADLPPGTFYIDPERLKSWCAIFEPPAPDEFSSRRAE